jgi:hypothetical protein
MKSTLSSSTPLLLILALLAITPTHSQTEPAPFANQGAQIVVARDASAAEQFAAREVRRYVYLRTGRLLDIVARERVLASHPSAFVVGTKRRAAALAGTLNPALAAELASLPAQTYQLKTLLRRTTQTLFVAGGDDAATLYAAYRLAEYLGVRFHLHGDVIPDERIAFSIPLLDERKSPLFSLRGIQPFHDFPEGPDWWNADDYLAVIGQLPKLRMNFFGLHTYPEGHPNAEPTVWIGTAGDIGEGGKVKFSYPSSWMSTLRGNWGYAPKKTGDYVFGAAQLFERDDFAAEVMWEYLPQPTTPEASNELFERAADLLRDAFSFARQVGVQTCVGTETPLVPPKLVQERLKAAGKDPTDLATVRELYEGIFRRAAQAYPLDWYWLWTPEGWTWSPVSEAQITATTNDLLTAYAALKGVNAPFQLATCGWVLGPQQDRALFDKMLPKDVAVSCINREVGKTPVDAGFADVSGRGKWAIPWLEDDPGLTEPQFWVGRMRRDAADALRYGCDGLMGIHWRTRVLAPNVAALAQAAWDQQPWLTSYQGQIPAPTERVFGPIGGNVAHFPNSPIADTEDDPLYQNVRYDLKGYRLPASNGLCTVTLKFCEPHYAEAGRRVFDVKLQGKTVVRNLDMFARVGKDRALDFTYTNVVVANGWVDVDFVPRIEFPCIAAIAVEGGDWAVKVNCGGGVWKDYLADPGGAESPKQVYADSADFYDDWCAHEFGANIAPAASAIFRKLDCATPRPAEWVNGPGRLQPNGQPWSAVRKNYAFVDTFAGLRRRVSGAGNLERFDYWLNTFKYLRAMAEAGCAWAEFNREFQKAKEEKDPAAQARLAREHALPAREKLVLTLDHLYDFLLATVTNPGELGTVCNWEQHNLPDILEKPGEELAKLLGEPLPASAQPRKIYRGLPRLIVPTVRTSVREGEPLKLKAIVLSESPVTVTVHWRKMGGTGFRQVPFLPVARGVHTVTLPAAATKSGDLEYYITAGRKEGEPLRFPATAPALCQTVVVYPAAGQALSR